MRYLLDTCVLSELCKARPNASVIQWLTYHDEQSFFISVLTIGELAKGIAKVPLSDKRNDLDLWMKHDLQDRFRQRILPIDHHVAVVWGTLAGQAELDGAPLPVIDCLLAATAHVHNLTIVTRNIKDFPDDKPPIINPWS